MSNGETCTANGIAVVWTIAMDHKTAVRNMGLKSGELLAQKKTVDRNSVDRGFVIYEYLILVSRVIFDDTTISQVNQLVVRNKIDVVTHKVS